ncbi:ABC-type nitrate/sulfonate/bicarbonate transport system substrate-binding protein [Hydrogenispora ethanolica]|uniref:ABC-type nitrate/sulfonate/bicarbonate transport system substrate-binding protein n=1 Tax=Hydrogenispora ethanolica TaxID=1082276 RepID=A0A4R1QTR6_HYDET|nr:ABC transporter substrate-binding protein [Hydrogenispora ethanolica]TCL56471.1 ABC-type nitrate/sulfonate/bicarbonate transport system substrate-binding protein [Hydrogenispora ethanolica]
MKELKTVLFQRLLFFAAVLLFISAAGLSYGEEKLAVFKAGAQDWQYVAREKGWLDQAFAKIGTKFEITEYGVGNEGILFERGDLHIAQRMLYPAILAKSAGFDIVVVQASKHPEPKIASIVVPADSPIKTFDDLKGKKVAAWRLGCPYMVLFEQLEQHNWDLSDIKFVNIPATEYKTVLLSKEVDAIAVHPHIEAAPLILQGLAREIAYPAKDSNYVNGGGITVAFTLRSVAEKYPDVLKLYIKIQDQTRKWILKNQDEAARIVEKNRRVPAAISKFAWERSSATWGNELSYQKLVTESERTQDWLIKHQDIPANKRVDLKELFAKKYFK